MLKITLLISRLQQYLAPNIYIIDRVLENVYIVLYSIFPKFQPLLLLFINILSILLSKCMHYLVFSTEINKHNSNYILQCTFIKVLLCSLLRIQLHIHKFFYLLTHYNKEANSKQIRILE